jgi:hypothetical protein
MRTLDVLSSKELGEVNAFLGELKDSVTYQKRLAALEAKKKEINDLILVVGKVREIENLRVKTRQLNKGADEFVKKLQANLEDAAKKIEADKAASRKFITERESAAQKRIVDREAALLAGETDIGKREKVLAKASDDLIVRDLKVASDLTLSKEIFTKYTEAVASLKNELARIQKEL